LNLAEFQQARERRRALEVAPRLRCLVCRNCDVICYCAQIKPVRTHIQFVILIHRTEIKRSVATGRMTHLSLPDSVLFEGTDFSEHRKLNAIIEDPSNHPMLLYPGARAVNLTALQEPERQALLPAGKKPVVILIDATWSHAKRIRRMSTNLHRLPQIAFSPTKPSMFRVRIQPNELCYSTIEATHHLIGLLDEGAENLNTMLAPFHWMVEKQLKFAAPLGVWQRRRSRPSIASTLS
jgi:DTW domain-containing protein